MATVTTSLTERAESIFTDLGYVVEDEGAELRAVRKWRVVQVTPVDRHEETPDSGTFRCFVTWGERATEVQSRLANADPDYEWAVMGVDENGEYDVYHAPQSPLPA